MTTDLGQVTFPQRLEDAVLRGFFDNVILENTHVHYDLIKVGSVFHAFGHRWKIMETIHAPLVDLFLLRMKRRQETLARLRADPKTVTFRPQSLSMEIQEWAADSFATLEQLVKGTLDLLAVGVWYTFRDMGAEFTVADATSTNSTSSTAAISGYTSPPTVLGPRRKKARKGGRT